MEKKREMRGGISRKGEKSGRMKITEGKSREDREKGKVEKGGLAYREKGGESKEGRQRSEEDSGKKTKE